MLELVAQVMLAISAIYGGGNAGGSYTNASESYDGSSWTTSPDLNSGQRISC